MVENEDEQRVTKGQGWGRENESNKDYLEAREGDALMTPFECNVCAFRQLKGRDPNLRKQQDQFLLDLIWSADLDAFWSRLRSTVNQNLSKIRMLL